MEPSSLGTCSVTCGKGVQQQLMQCIRLYENGTDEIVDQSHCENASLILPQKQCDLGPCGFLEWGAGEWSMVCTFGIMICFLDQSFSNLMNYLMCDLERERASFSR